MERAWLAIIENLMSVIITFGRHLPQRAWPWEHWNILQIQYNYMNISSPSGHWNIVKYTISFYEYISCPSGHWNIQKSTISLYEYIESFRALKYPENQYPYMNILSAVGHWNIRKRPRSLCEYIESCKALKYPWKCRIPIWIYQILQGTEISWKVKYPHLYTSSF